MNKGKEKNQDSISLVSFTVKHKIIDMSNGVLKQITSQVTLLHLLQCSWTNLLILQAYRSFLFLFHVSTAGKCWKSFCSAKPFSCILEIKTFLNALMDS